MAHNLASLNGQVQFAYEGSTPWHRLGQRIIAGSDVRAAMDAAQLNYTVSVRRLTLPDGRLSPFSADVVRDDTGAILGGVTPTWTPIQNGAAFSVLQDACEHHGLAIASAGALGQGERAFMLARMRETLEPVAGDNINGYLLIVNGHGGTQSYHARFTPIRVVCQNTLNAAMGGGKDFVEIRHTSNSGQRLNAAQKLIDQTLRTLKTTGETFAQLAARAMGPKEIADYITAVFPADADGSVSDTTHARRDKVAVLVFNGRGAQLAGSDLNTGTSTAWAAYNAVTEYFDHVRPAECKTDKARAQSDLSSIFGLNATIKARAFASARQLVA